MTTEKQQKQREQPKKSWFKKGFTPWNKGLKTGLVPKTAFKKGREATKEWKELMSQIMHEKHKNGEIDYSNFRRGQNHPNWQGGGNPYLYVGHFWRTKRKQILERDNYICKRCEIKIEKSFNATVDHIIPFRYSKNNSDDNLQTLCRSCNVKKQWEDNGKYT